MGQGATGVAQSEFSNTSVNPANISQTKEVSIYTSYLLPYFIQDLSEKELGLVIPFKKANLGFSINQYGFDLYQENSVAITYARNLMPNLSLGFQMNILQHYIKQSGSGYQLVSSMGIIYDVSSVLSFGAQIYNIEESSFLIEEFESPIPSLFVFGFSWKPVSQFELSGEYEKVGDYTSLLKFGMEYKPGDIVVLRTGVLGKPINYTLGAGIYFNRFEFDVAMAHHAVLGVSSSFGITYSFSKVR